MHARAVFVRAVSGPNADRRQDFSQLSAGGYELLSISAGGGLLCAIRFDGTHACRGRTFIDSRALIAATR